MYNLKVTWIKLKGRKSQMECIGVGHGEEAGTSGAPSEMI